MKEKILKVKNLMTNLRNWNDWDIKHYPLSQDEAEVVMDACLKMVPMKLAKLEADPKVWPKGYYDVCPNEECGQKVLGDIRFCPMCGQAFLREGKKDELL